MPDDSDKKLDWIIHLLEDLFILQALSANMRRENIRAILGVHTTRISKITGGLKRGRRDVTQMWANE